MSDTPSNAFSAARAFWTFYFFRGPKHDPVYRRIFNRAQIIEQILRRFATGPWAAHLDFSTLAPVPTDFIAKYLKKYEADIIWRVRYGPEKGGRFYVFVLLELQSSVQRFMALRVLGYVLQLCETLLEHGRYLAAHDELEGVVNDPDLAADIASLVSDVALKLELDDEELPRARNLEEVRMSLLQRAEKWTQQWMAEGEAIGQAEGQRLGMARTLKNLLQRRFGDLPDWTVDRVDRADVDTLERWSYLVLDARVLDEVFRDDEPARESGPNVP